MSNLRARWFKLQQAVESMATTGGSANERLYNAWVSHVVSLQPSDFPGDLADRFAALHDLVTGYGFPRDPDPRDERDGTLRTTIDGMTEDEVLEIAERLVDFAASVRFEMEEEARPD